MAYPIEEALTRVPALWVPGKKPTGNVKVNSENPLTDGLIHYWPMIPPNEIKDYAGTWDLTDFYGATTFHAQDNTYGRDSSGSTTARMQFTTADIGTTHTLLAGLYLDVGNDLIFGGQSAYGCYFSGVSYYKPGSNSVSVTDTFTTPAYQTLCVARKDTNVRFFRNGIQIGTDQTLAANESYDNLETLTGYPNGNYSINGRYFYAVIWDRQLSDTEIYSLYIDPYQLLMPA